MKPSVALLNCSRNDDEDDSERNFRREFDAKLHEYMVPHGEFPDETRDFDAVVISGSRASVYSEEMWVDRTKEWVSDAIERGIPTLGVCFGHQLVAEVLGGRVRPMVDPDWEFGFEEVRCRTESRLFEGVDETFTTFTVHADEVTELPEDAVRLAGNDNTDVQAFRDGHAFGVQFHPEFDVHTAIEVMEMRDIPPEQITETISSLRDNIREYTQVKRIFDNFCAFALERADAERMHRRPSASENGQSIEGEGGRRAGGQ